MRISHTKDSGQFGWQWKSHLMKYDGHIPSHYFYDLCSSAVQISILYGHSNVHPVRTSSAFSRAAANMKILRKTLQIPWFLIIGKLPRERLDHDKLLKNQTLAQPKCSWDIYQKVLTFYEQSFTPVGHKSLKVRLSKILWGRNSLLSEFQTEGKGWS